jgi:cell division protein FtsA
LVDVVNSPVYATGVGLIVYGSRNFGAREFPTTKSEDSIFGNAVRRMKTWFKEFF